MFVKISVMDSQWSALTIQRLLRNSGYARTRKISIVITFTNGIYVYFMILKESYHKHFYNIINNYLLKVLLEWINLFCGNRTEDDHRRNPRGRRIKSGSRRCSTFHLAIRDWLKISYLTLDIYVLSILHLFRWMKLLFVK